MYQRMLFLQRLPLKDNFGNKVFFENKFECKFLKTIWAKNFTIFFQRHHEKFASFAKEKMYV